MWNNFTQVAWKERTLYKLIGFIKNENISMDDKVKVVLHMSSVIGFKCTSEEDAIRQIKKEMM